MKITSYSFGTFEVLAVPVLSDNFVYLVCRDGQGVLIDAGEAKPVFLTLEKEILQLTDILITHTHHDHIGGCRALQDQLGVQSTSPGVESGEIPMLGTVCRSFSTPGHMAVHKCYHFPELGILFTGDTIINGACGRILGGTAEQYFQSLEIIKALPDETMIFGGHDYLAENMQFALSVEPRNEAAKGRLALYETDPPAAVFQSLENEKRSNPFLQVKSPEEFAALRKLKDHF